MLPILPTRTVRITDTHQLYSSGSIGITSLSTHKTLVKLETANETVCIRYHVSTSEFNFEIERFTTKLATVLFSARKNPGGNDVTDEFVKAKPKGRTVMIRARPMDEVSVEQH